MTTAWMSDAACAGVGTDVFYPDSQLVGEAQRICATCPVRLTCLEDALTRRDYWGIQGGLDGDQRRALNARTARGETVAAQRKRRSPDVTNDARDGTMKTPAPALTDPGHGPSEITGRTSR